MYEHATASYSIPLWAPSLPLPAIDATSLPVEYQTMRRAALAAMINPIFLAALVLQFPIKHPPLTGHLPALNTVEKAAAAAVGSAISGSDRPIRDKSSCGARRYGSLVRSVPFNFDFGIKQAPSTNRMPMSLYVRIADQANKLR